jgi:hypothetical protein
MDRGELSIPAISIGKGLGFVLTTTIILYLYLRRADPVTRQRDRLPEFGQQYAGFLH